MAHIVALDIGLKRTGIAITDELQIIASGLETIATSALIPRLKVLKDELSFTTLVIGMPVNLNGSDTDATALVHKMAEEIKEALANVEITFVDERFTSKLATQSLVMSGTTKKRRTNKSLVDEVSATLILQTYLSLKA